MTTVVPLWQPDNIMLAPSAPLEDTHNDNGRNHSSSSSWNDSRSSLHSDLDSDDDPSSDHVAQHLRRTESYVQSLPTAQAERDPVLPAHRGSEVDEAVGTAQVAAWPLSPTGDGAGWDVSPSNQSTDQPSAAKPAQRRPGFIQVRVHKPDINTKLGIVLESVEGCLSVESIRPHGLLALSPLRPGDIITSINGMPCRSLNGWQGAKVLQTLTEYILIMAEPPNGDPQKNLVCVYKRTPEARLGIRFGVTDGALQISRTNPDGAIGAESLITEGDFVLAINGLECHGALASTATAMVVAEPDAVTLLLSASNQPDVSTVPSRQIQLMDQSRSFRNIPMAPSPTTATQRSLDFDPDLSHCWEGHEPMYVSVTLRKLTHSTKLGIMIKSIDGRLRITDIRPSGLLFTSPLRPGMHILSINNRSCPRVSTTTGVKILKNTVGLLHIVASNPDGDPNYTQAMAAKLTPRSKIGIVFNSRGNRLRLGCVRPQSPFAYSTLNSDDHVLAINNVPAACLSVRQAIGIVAEASGGVTILAKRHAESAVVISEIAT